MIVDYFLIDAASQFQLFSAVVFAFRLLQMQKYHIFSRNRVSRLFFINILLFHPHHAIFRPLSCSFRPHPMFLQNPSEPLTLFPEIGNLLFL